MDGHVECDVLVLEFQRVTRRLAQLGLLSRRSSDRFIEQVNRHHAAADAAGRALPALLRQILLGIEDGTLLNRRDYLRRGNTVVALHVESAARVMYRAKRTVLTAQAMRRLFYFGRLHVCDAVTSCSARVSFGAKDRRRAVILNVEKAQEFVGGRFFPVPFY
jgi:hypothetical protein